MMFQFSASQPNSTSHPAAISSPGGPLEPRYQPPWLDSLSAAPCDSLLESPTTTSASSDVVEQAHTGIPQTGIPGKTWQQVRQTITAEIVANSIAA